MHRDQIYGLRLAGAARNREAEMTEPAAVLEAAHTAISDLAAVLVAVRAPGSAAPVSGPGAIWRWVRSICCRRGTPSRRPAWKSILLGPRLPTSA